MVDIWGMNVGKQKRSSHGSVMGFDVTHPQHAKTPNGPLFSLGKKCMFFLEEFYFRKDRDFEFEHYRLDQCNRIHKFQVLMIDIVPTHPQIPPEKVFSGMFCLMYVLRVQSHRTSGPLMF